MNEGSRARPIARAWKTLLRRVDAWTRRKTGVGCPLCERRARRFDPHPATGRKDARCRRCGALERHRFVWEFLRRRTSLCGGGGGARVRMLHLAPEPSLGAKLRAIAGLSRVTLDIGMPPRRQM